MVADSTTPSANSTTFQSPARALLAASRQGTWPQVEELWQKLPIDDVAGTVFGSELMPDLKLFLAESQKKHPKGSAAITDWYEFLLADAAEKSPRGVLNIILFGDVPLLDSDSLRSGLLDLLATVHGDNVDALSVEADFPRTKPTDPMPFRLQLGVFSQLARVHTGGVFRHKFYDLGRVDAIDFAAKTITMSFPPAPGKKLPNAPVIVKFDHRKELLTPIAPDYIVDAGPGTEPSREPNANYLRVSDPAAMREMAENEPGRLVELMALAQKGSIKQAELKALLLQGPMDEAGFKKWWGNARANVVRHDRLKVEGTGASCVFVRLAKAKDFHSVLSEKFSRAATLAERLDAMLNIMRAARDKALPPAGVESVLAVFRAAEARKKSMTSAERISWEYLAAMLLAVLPDAKVPFHIDVAAEIKGNARPADVVLALEVPDFIIGALPDLKAAFPDTWPQVAAEVAERAPLRALRKYLDELVAAKQESVAADLISRVVSFPRRNPDAYMWALKELLTGKVAQELHMGLDAHHMIDDLLSLLEELQRSAHLATPEDEKGLRAFVNKLAKMISESEFKLIADFILKLPVEEARAFYRELHTRKLDETFIQQMLRAMRRTRNDLEDSRGIPVSEAETTILCTEAAYRQKLSELDKLKNVDIPANSKAIGVARELGDLRENAEYQTAKDMQKVLMARMGELTAQIARARQVPADGIDTTAVNFGTKFVAKNDAGDQVSYTLLGPWESDPDKGIISYQAPLGKTFHKRKIGDAVDVTLPNGKKSKFTIATIDKA